MTWLPWVGWASLAPLAYLWFYDPQVGRGGAAVQYVLALGLIGVSYRRDRRHARGAARLEADEARPARGAGGAADQWGRSERATSPKPAASRPSMSRVLNRLVG